MKQIQINRLIYLVNPNFSIIFLSCIQVIQNINRLLDTLVTNKTRILEASSPSHPLVNLLPSRPKERS